MKATTNVEVRDPATDMSPQHLHSNSTTSFFAITRKYWDHLREKIILGPSAYLKFPPFHDPV
jgi:hypothetical protein